VYWTNFAAAYRRESQLLLANGAIQQADRRLQEAQGLLEWRLQEQPSILRYQEALNQILWYRLLLAYLDNDLPSAEQHFRAMRFTDPGPDGPPRWDPRNMVRAAVLAICPLEHFRDPITSKEIILAGFDQQTSNPSWWAVRAVCHYRLGEIGDAKQALAKADRHWRSPDPFTEVVRALLYPERRRATQAWRVPRLPEVLAHGGCAFEEALVLERELLAGTPEAP
jgi:hypothetical protein